MSAKGKHTKKIRRGYYLLLFCLLFLSIGVSAVYCQGGQPPSSQRMLLKQAGNTEISLLTGLNLTAVNGGSLPAGESCRLPVLMYHHFATKSDAYTVVSTARFQEQMAALHRAGYETVSMAQIRDYVYKGQPLPPKPIMITMDDGYRSNLEIAAPILAEYGLGATVFVIGVHEGEPYDVRTGQPFCSERFAYEEAAQWWAQGVIDPQSHGFDLHQQASDGLSGRDGILPMLGESPADYRAALAADASAFAQRRGDGPTPLTAFSYPYGFFTEEADAILQDLGFDITFTIEDHSNTLIVGDPSSLRLLGRLNVIENMSGSKLLADIKNQPLPE